MSDSWPIPLEELLRRTGQPERLEECAERLDELGATDDSATNHRRKDAAAELRRLAEAARASLEEVEDLGLRMNWERGCLEFPGQGTPKVLNRVIAWIVQDLQPDPLYTLATYEHVRGALAHLGLPSERLTDTRIRKALEHHW